MNSIITIASNELRRLFYSPFAWIVFAVVQFLLAIFFYLLLSKFMQLASWSLDRGLTEIVVVGLFQIAGLVLLLVSPFITMRLFSEELRSGTIKLLLSSPISIVELVLGKFLGAMLYFLSLIAIIALMPLTLVFGTTLDPGLLFCGLTALLLLSSAFVAIGLFISSLSNAPALAAIGSFVITLFLWIIHIANDTQNVYVDGVANYLSLQKHFNSLLSGALSSIDVVYFVLLSVFFVVLSIWRLDSLRTHQ